MPTPEQSNAPAFKIIPDDRDFVERIGKLIPLESADREALATIIAGHRQMHAASSPAAEVERQLELMVRKNVNLHRLLWALVTKLGGTAEIKDADIPFDWGLELNPIAGAKSLEIKATRCAPPAPANDKAPGA